MPCHKFFIKFAVFNTVNFSFASRPLCIRIIAGQSAMHTQTAAYTCVARSVRFPLPLRLQPNRFIYYVHKTKSKLAASWPVHNLKIKTMFVYFIWTRTFFFCVNIDMVMLIFIFAREWRDTIETALNESYIFIRSTAFVLWLSSSLNR